MSEVEITLDSGETLWLMEMPEDRVCSNCHTDMMEESIHPAGVPGSRTVTVICRCPNCHKVSRITTRR